MFKLVRHYPIFRRATLLLFLFPLMFTGGSFLGGFAQQQSIGAVGSFSIPRTEFSSRYQQNAERYRRTYGVDTISAQAHQGIVEQTQSHILSEYLLRASTDGKGVFAPDKLVAAVIGEVEDFHDEDGNFSAEIYNSVVPDRRRYQQLVRSNINNRPLFAAFNSLPLEAVREKLAAFRRQQRIVDEGLLEIDTLSEIVPTTIENKDVNDYYQNNARNYLLNEEADFEYFVVSLDDYAATRDISDEETRAAYDDYLENREVFERRRASHIYVTDKEQADALYERAAAAPSAFADLARDSSEDAGSAGFGGDLGIVADGDLPDALNEAVFSMDVGEILPPLETEDGGYSILKLDEIVVEAPPSFAAVREEMELAAKREQARDDFEAAVESLRSIAAEEIGSLENMADKADAAVLTLTAVTRVPEDNPAPFNDDIVIEDAFDSFVTEEGENSPPIPLGENAYVFVRSTRYQEERLETLQEVAEEIWDHLRTRELIEFLYRQIAAERNEKSADNEEIAGLDDSLALESGENEENGESEENKEDGETESIEAESVEAESVEAEGVEAESVGAESVEAENVEAESVEAESENAENADDKETSKTVKAEDILKILEEMEWSATHTVVLANAGNDDDDNDDNAGDLENKSINLIFTADLTHGLPAYIFEPQEGKIRVFRVRETLAGEAEEEDFQVVDEMIGRTSEELAQIGYINELATEHRYEFFNLPETEFQGAAAPESAESE